MNTEKEILELNMRFFTPTLTQKAIEFITNEHAILNMELEKHSEGLTNRSVIACVAYVYRHKNMRFLEWAIREYAKAQGVI